MKRNIIIALSLFAAFQVQAQQMLSLDEVKQRALEYNMAARTADNAIQQAEEQKKEAFTKYFPTISALGMGFQTNHDILKKDFKLLDKIPEPILSKIPPELAPLIPQEISFGILDKGIMAGVTAIQPVFAGGRIINGNKLAKINVQAGYLQKQMTSNTVTLTAEQYYWQIITLKEKQKTLDAVGEMLDKYAKDADVAVKAGVGMRNDLLAVKLKQNEIESNKLKLANGLKLAKMVLAQYIGMEGQDIDVISSADPSQLPPYPIVKANHEEAVAITPEYRLLQKKVEATTLQRKMEVGKNLPSIGIGAGYNYYKMDGRMENNFGAIFATVSIPISQWWGGSHAIKRKKLAEQNAREQLEDNSQLLKIRMQKNWNDVDDAYKQLKLAKESIEQSEENLRLNRDFYQAGTVPMNDLLNAQQLYQQSRDRYTDAYAQLQTKILEYKQSIGE
ncbi:MAG: TolC family protein [Prevotella sp.]|jgi:outer membrane protein